MRCTQMEHRAHQVPAYREMKHITGIKNQELAQMHLVASQHLDASPRPGLPDAGKPEKTQRVQSDKVHNANGIRQLTEEKRRKVPCRRTMSTYTESQVPKWVDGILERAYRGPCTMHDASRFVTGAHFVGGCTGFSE